ncbi:myelin transcription factor 1-like [Uranotaenia lowii]|uniref:myelin transcription factor 1-like n=1 Tax=Uranotaenia lowii TaxID=190385 RepID=UPI002478DEEC|nr:myelin transcription factor 1-like [Uranotaenia lowii]XP_055610832.1 myelin transcription factor 1-like [Uranotaenia lowii]
MDPTKTFPHPAAPQPSREPGDDETAPLISDTDLSSQTLAAEEFESWTLVDRYSPKSSPRPKKMASKGGTKPGRDTKDTKIEPKEEQQRVEPVADDDEEADEEEEESAGEEPKESGEEAEESEGEEREEEAAEEAPKPSGVESVKVQARDAEERSTNDDVTVKKISKKATQRAVAGGKHLNVE